MKRITFVVLFLVAASLLFWYIGEQGRIRDARVDASFLLNRCIDNSLKDSPLADSAGATLLLEKGCAKEVALFRRDGCEKQDGCELQIQNRIKRNIATAQKRKVAADRLKQETAQQAAEIKKAADKLGMTEDELFDWILKHFKEELLEALEDDFKERLTE